MSTEDQDDRVAPSEQRGGSTPSEREVREKGQWAATAAEGIVPAELGGSDAPSDPQGEDSQLGSEVLGATTGSDAPATEEGVDPHGGSHADATSDGGPESEPGGEPDLRDAAAGPRQSDRDSSAP